MASKGGIPDGPASTSGLVSMHCLYSAAHVFLLLCMAQSNPSFQTLCFSFVKLVLKHVEIRVILKLIRSSYVYAHSYTEDVPNVP